MGNLCVGSTDADAENVEFWTRAQETQREMIQVRLCRSGAPLSRETDALLQDKKDTDDSNLRWWKSSFAEYTPGMSLSAQLICTPVSPGVYNEASEAEMRLNKSGIWHMVEPPKPVAVA